MLQRLHIRNYAIIDEIKVQFQPGLNIITGETGAGKSILMGALGLVLGNRADTSVLFEPGEKCFVEAVFITANLPSLRQVLTENELDHEEELVLRRELAASGKSRSFVNDTPVTLQVLRQVALCLVDLHRQFDTLSLSDNQFQREVLDALAGHQGLLQDYRRAYKGYSALHQKLTTLQIQQKEANREHDYQQFLLSELQALALQPGELEELELEIKRLSNAEEIKSALSKLSFALQESEPSIVQQVKTLAQQLHPFRDTDNALGELAARLQSAYIELNDIAAEANRTNDRLYLDAARLQMVSDRLGEGYRLQKKHGVHTTAALLDIQEKLEQALSQTASLDQQIAETQIACRQAWQQCLQMANQLTEGRNNAAIPLQMQTQKLLAQMGMPNAAIHVQITPAGDGENALHAYGADFIHFLFDANKSNRFEPLDKVASGGELSRLMLAIKSQVAHSMQLPALIFDEIDTGISGEAARQVGLLLHQLAINHQVLAITHQPQIAARAQAHFYVYKSEEQGRLRTRIRLLSHNERINNIAQMLSGADASESALQTAREMVNATATFQ